MSGLIFVWNLKSTLSNSQQNILPIHLKMFFLDIKIKEHLDLRACNILKCPPGLYLYGTSTWRFKHKME